MVELPAPSTPVIETSTVDWARSVEADSAYTDVNSVPKGRPSAHGRPRRQTITALRELSTHWPQLDSKAPKHCCEAKELALI